MAGKLPAVRTMQGDCLWSLNYVAIGTFFNTLRPRQNRRHFADDIFRCNFFNENVSISIKISLKFVPKGPINNIPSLVQIMAWRRPGDKPLSEPIVVNLPTHVCFTRPQWINSGWTRSQPMSEDVSKTQFWGIVSLLRKWAHFWQFNWLLKVSKRKG